jgi:hypothetical protein
MYKLYNINMAHVDCKNKVDSISKLFGKYVGSIV